MMKKMRTGMTSIRSTFELITLGARSRIVGMAELRSVSTQLAPGVKSCREVSYCASLEANELWS